VRKHTTATMVRLAPALVLLAAPVSALAASQTPLLDYALAQSFEIPPRDIAYSRRLADVEHELRQNPPPQSGCAEVLGAKRFASIYSDLGAARSNLADYAGAVEAFENALACTPRVAYLYGVLAAELIHLGRYLEARAIAEQGFEVDEREDSLNRVLAQLDYIEERWPDAAKNLRKAVASVQDNDDAVYWQCLLWLAQRRGGMLRPQIISRESGEKWPQPIMATLLGDLDEAGLVKNIESEKDSARRREILAEALYYIGQRRLADNQHEMARRYLAATVNLKVHYFVEHHLALAELAKFRARAEAL
jgi:lipoprotein NlpI